MSSPERSGDEDIGEFHSILENSGLVDQDGYPIDSRLRFPDPKPDPSAGEMSADEYIRWQQANEIHDDDYKDNNG